MIVNFPIARMVNDALADGERKVEAEASTTRMAVQRIREQNAYDLFLLREDATHEVWFGGPFGLTLEEDQPCPLCGEKMKEGPGVGWYARNSDDEWMVAHCHCAKRALRFGTPPGMSGHGPLLITLVACQKCGQAAAAPDLCLRCENGTLRR